MINRLDISRLDDKDPTQREQEMTEGREINVNVHSGKKDFLSGEHKMTHDSQMNLRISNVGPVGKLASRLEVHTKSI